MLIHDFDVFRWILCMDLGDGGDAADTLHATGSVLVDPEIAQVPDVDSTAVTIRTKKGRLCQINTSRRAAYGYDQRFEVLGSKGLLQCGNHRPTEVLQLDGDSVRADKPEHFFLQRYREAYRLELAHFFDRLQSGAAFRTTIADGVEAQKLADAAAQSLASAKGVQL
jgi:myo-inositol 2-dehydrogenase/D-chiro-inositol 1-dehydrogenase